MIDAHSSIYYCFHSREHTMGREELIILLKECKKEISTKYGIVSLSLFGSRAQGDDRSDSDVDLLVEFETTPDLFRFIEMEETISSRIGFPVDLVRESVLRPELKESVFLHRIEL
jgi:uncharacterized protein